MLKTVICKTMSDETLPGIFKTIDDIMETDGKVYEVVAVTGSLFNKHGFSSFSVYFICFCTSNSMSI